MINVADVLERLARNETEKAAKLRSADGMVSNSDGLLNLSRASGYRVAAENERANHANY